MDKECLVAEVRACEEGGGSMVINWLGDPDAMTVFMGTDELMTLTPEERQVRDQILKMLVAAQALKEPAPEPETPCSVQENDGWKAYLTSMIYGVGIAVTCFILYKFTISL